MVSKNEHYKMYKSGKQWLFAAVAAFTVAAGAQVVDQHQGFSFGQGLTASANDGESNVALETVVAEDSTSQQPLTGVTLSTSDVDQSTKKLTADGAAKLPKNYSDAAGTVGKLSDDGKTLTFSFVENALGTVVAEDSTSQQPLTGVTLSTSDVDQSTKKLTADGAAKLPKNYSDAAGTVGKLSDDGKTLTFSLVKNTPATTKPATKYVYSAKSDQTKTLSLKDKAATLKANSSSDTVLQDEQSAPQQLFDADGKTYNLDLSSASSAYTDTTDDNGVPTRTFNYVLAAADPTTPTTPTTTDGDKDQTATTPSTTTNDTKQDNTDSKAATTATVEQVADTQVSNLPQSGKRASDNHVEAAGLLAAASLSAALFFTRSKKEEK